MDLTIQASADMTLPRAAAPTMYFIGVTTAHSAMRRIFPRWAARLGLGGSDAVRLVGVDFKLHDDPAAYRRVVEFIRNDPLSRGALVTSHKIDLLSACRNLFDELDSYATLLGEVASISKREHKLIGRAFDPITGGLALDAFLPRDHWRQSGAQVLILGAGGSASAMSCHLLTRLALEERPQCVTITDRRVRRLKELQRLHESLGVRQHVQYVLAHDPKVNDACLAALPAGSLIINATGMGKDLPGSPLTDAAIFPEQGFAWDFNYRGELFFLKQARAQASSRGLHVEDGWVYFLHGWLHVIGEVFQIETPIEGPVFDELAMLAQ